MDGFYTVVSDVLLKVTAENENDQTADVVQCLRRTCLKAAVI